MVLEMSRPSRAAYSKIARTLNRKVDTENKQTTQFVSVSFSLTWFISQTGNPGITP